MYVSRALPPAITDEVIATGTAKHDGSHTQSARPKLLRPKS